MSTAACDRHSARSAPISATCTISTLDAPDTDYGEFKAAGSISPVEMLSLGGAAYHSLDYAQSGDDATYVEGNAALSLPYDISLSGAVGYQMFDFGVGLSDYATWNIGASYKWNAVTLDLRYYDTDVSSSTCEAEYPARKLLRRARRRHRQSRYVLVCVTGPDERAAALASPAAFALKASAPPHRGADIIDAEFLEPHHRLANNPAVALWSMREAPARAQPKDDGSAVRPGEPSAIRPRWVAGIDVGGTFTDLILYERGADEPARCASPRCRPRCRTRREGVLAAIAAAGVTPADLDLVIHGTTATTNAILERKIAQGRADHHARLSRHAGARPPHAAEALRAVRHVRAARSRASGGSRSTSAWMRGARSSCRSTRRRSPRRRGRCSPPAARASSSTSCMPTPIRRTSCAPARSSRDIWPNDYVTLGHRLLSEYREYERGTTASVNAAVQPILDRYISRLQGDLAGAGAFAATCW